MDSRKSNITIKGARVNNLKNVDVEIPRNKLVVITGLSGSGKSSLAFDTLYAEGQRRYVESLSAYARQFLGRMSKPEVDKITGLPPAIAIEQKVNTRNPRSTVGTSTEIYDYLRMLFARVGHTYSPVSGNEVKKRSAEDVVNAVSALPKGTKVAVSAPVHLPAGRTFTEQLSVYSKEGYSRLINTADGSFFTFDNFEVDSQNATLNYHLLIDRMSVSEDIDDISRLTDSVETAFFEGSGSASLWIWDGDAPRCIDFSNRFEADGMVFTEPNDQMFNFNNPYGACPRCEGFGKILGIDEHLVVPDPSLSVFDGAVACWRGEKMGLWLKNLIDVAAANDFPIHRPYDQLTCDQLDFLWHGNESFEGIDGFFRMVERNSVKIQYKVIAARYRGKTKCPACGGSRLRPEVNYVKVAGYTITELVAMPVSSLLGIFCNLKLPDVDAEIASRLITEIKKRLTFLCDVGLGYLTLDRLSNTLSGGESQRINLATSLGSSLMGSLYILDEPSIGLHSRDTQRLIKVLKQLRDIGNTVVVVEHDEDIIEAADWLIDVGKDAGRLGGSIVYTGPLHIKSPGKEVVNNGYTLRYLNGELSIPVPESRRSWRDFVEVKGAREHNLKEVSVRFPLGVFTAVTGVSGSGKSTLVRDILYRAVARELDDAGDAPGSFRKLIMSKQLKKVQMVDQNPIGKSSRSNPATYLGAYDYIRQLFAEQQHSRQLGLTPSSFSFNTEGGRCEECKGEGKITVEMQFMADITIVCEACHGQRFKKDVLEVKFHDRNIYDILEMTVEEAVSFFSGYSNESSLCRKISAKLQPLLDVGLGYIKLGQTSSTLSGGENQRVKLAYFLSQERGEATMFIFDEPTTGLHFHDIKRLLDSFNRLVDAGNTVIVIEHNMDVIKCADHVIDLGPEGGENGGNIVCEGTPEQVAGCAESYTGKFLANKLSVGILEQGRTDRM